MALFVVTYDLLKTQDYQSLWHALENHGGHRVTDSLWLLNMENNASDVLHWVQGLVHEDDRIFVAATTYEAMDFSKVLPGTLDWLKSHGYGV